MANGIIIYEGPSRVNPAIQIMVIATGLPNRGARSINAKTDSMVQVWILVNGMFPSEALRTGADAGICDTCILRPQVDSAGIPDLSRRGCYVELKSALSVYKAATGYVEPIRLQDGSVNPRGGQEWGPYERMHPYDAGIACAGEAIRLGAYGDPGAVPLWVWKAFLRGAWESGTKTWTGYTHRWRKLNVRTWGFLMASCDSPQDAQEAEAAGWRTFRGFPQGGSLLANEILCPASRGAGNRTTCKACGLCNGSRIAGAWFNPTGKRETRKAIGIPWHGAPNKVRYLATLNG